MTPPPGACKQPLPQGLYLIRKYSSEICTIISAIQDKEGKEQGLSEKLIPISACESVHHRLKADYGVKGTQTLEREKFK